MIKLNAPIDSIASSDLAVLKQIEQELSSSVANFLTQRKSLLSLLIDFEIFPKGTKDFEVIHNASLGLLDSYSTANFVKSFVDGRSSELSVCLKKHSLIVRINFRGACTEEKEEKNGVNDGNQGLNNQENGFVFEPIAPHYSFSQIILPENILNEIQDALKVIECRDLVYNTWGFSECDPIPKSVLNFYGEPGTGKTMCAHAIAHKLNKKLLALNYAEIESKYVGEAPKNLQKAFDIAKETDSILFFDEADSFLGKRIQNVTHGSEQALNSLRSQMLILLEEHSGIVVFATNLVTNFDKAFESRILKHIRFELPNKEARIAILKKMIPSRLPLAEPLTDSVFEQASSILEGFSGREIKGAILDMLLSKAEKGDTNVQFDADDLISVCIKKKEQKEQLKAEEQRLLKEKILKKMTEKNEEAKMEKELAESQENNQDECASEKSAETLDDAELERVDCC